MGKNTLHFLCLLCTTLAVSIPAAALQGAAGGCDITPDVKALKVPMAGYGARKGQPSTGVHDPIEAKVLVLQDGEARVALVAADLRSVTLDLKREILKHGADLGLSEDTLLLCATHNHSGPSIFAEAFWQRQFGVYDPQIVVQMGEKIAAALREAIGELEGVHLGYGECAAEGFTRNRRWKYDTEARESAGETPALDPTLRVLRMDNLDGKTVAVLVNYPTHPTILGADNMELSAEWPGVLRDALEAAFPGAVALFANGAEGDQAPEAKEGADAFARMDAFGKALAEKAADCLRTVKPEAVEHLAAARQTPALPEIVFSKGAQEGPYTDMLPLALEALPRKAEMQVLAIGDIALVGLPGEPIEEVGAATRNTVEAAGFAHVMVLGLANDYIGYILNEKEYAHGGYEVDSRSYYGPGLGDFIAEAAGAAAASIAP